MDRHGGPGVSMLQGAVTEQWQPAARCRLFFRLACFCRAFRSPTAPAAGICG